MKHDYTLYYYPTCPYCRKVFRAMDEMKIDLPKKDATVPEIAEELIRIGGKDQVPCLVIDGKAMYESDDIIAYLRAEQG